MRIVLDRTFEWLRVKVFSDGYVEIYTRLGMPLSSGLLEFDLSGKKENLQCSAVLTRKRFTGDLKNALEVREVFNLEVNPQEALDEILKAVKDAEDDSPVKEVMERIVSGAKKVRDHTGYTLMCEGSMHNFVIGQDSWHYVVLKGGEVEPVAGYEEKEQGRKLLEIFTAIANGEISPVEGKQKLEKLNDARRGSRIKIA